MAGAQNTPSARRQGDGLLPVLRQDFFLERVDELVKLILELVYQILLVIGVRRNPPQLIDDVVPGGVLDLLDWLPLVLQHWLEDGREIPEDDFDLALQSLLDRVVEG